MAFPQLSLADISQLPREYEWLEDSGAASKTVVADQGPNERIIVTSFSIMADGAADFYFLDDSGAITGVYRVDALGGVAENDLGGLFQTEANSGLYINCSAAVDYSVRVTYVTTKLG